MDKKVSSYYWVGKISPAIAKIVNFDYTGVVYMSGGVIKHVLKKHKSQLSKQNLNDLVSCIKMVIRKPDYIGAHPDKPNKSVELVKYIHNNHILVAIEFDEENDYIYVASMYPITDAKLKSRLESKRLKKLELKQKKI